MPNGRDSALHCEGSGAIILIFYHKILIFWRWVQSDTTKCSTQHAQKIGGNGLWGPTAFHRGQLPTVLHMFLYCICTYLPNERASALHCEGSEAIILIFYHEILIFWRWVQSDTTKYSTQHAQNIGESWLWGPTAFHRGQLPIVLHMFCDVSIHICLTKGTAHCTARDPKQ